MLFRNFPIAPNCDSNCDTFKMNLMDTQVSIEMYGGHFSLWTLLKCTILVEMYGAHLVHLVEKELGAHIGFN